MAKLQHVSFRSENQKRIEAVERSFRPVGVRLVEPKRVLIGEGRLLKQSRRGPQPKAFFLFNDVLVYGSIVINGHWFKGQRVVPLEDVEQEDLQNNIQMKYQWLIKTPQKSFFVSAASLEEKVAWMEHIELCKSRLLQSGRTAGSAFAVTWIPDPASHVCMRCYRKFTVAHRRHHCRKCGLLVCGACSTKRAVIEHIHPSKRLRVCEECHGGLSQRGQGYNREGRSDSDKGRDQSEEGQGYRAHGDSTGLSDEDLSADEDDEDEGHRGGGHDPGYWAESFSPYVYLKPEHVWPSTLS